MAPQIDYGQAIQAIVLRPDQDGAAGIDPALLRWLAKQSYRLEQSEAGRIREDVARYFAAADKFIARVTGRERALTD